MTGLTRTQWELLAFIHCFIGDRGYSPTLDQMGKGLGKTGKGNTHRLLEVLEARGYIARFKGQACSTTLTNRGVGHVNTYLTRSQSGAVSRETVAA